MRGYHTRIIDPNAGAKISRLPCNLAHDIYKEFTRAETVKAPPTIGVGIIKKRIKAVKSCPSAFNQIFIRPLSSIASFNPQL